MNGNRGRNTTVESVLAAVRVAPSKTEIREFPMPDIPPDSALLKMEVAGICGTDVKLYKEPLSSAPVIMGHENIGYIARTGSEFTTRQGFKEGDLVFLEHYVSLPGLAMYPMFSCPMITGALEGGSLYNFTSV